MAITILNCPSEICAYKRGGSLGFEAVRTAARQSGSEFFGQMTTVDVAHQNHLLDHPDPNPHAKRIEGLKSVYEGLVEAMGKEFDAGNFPVVLTGDHSLGGGVLAGVSKAFPKHRLGVVWIDAHADIHSPYTTPSGNMHGMPLAIALNLDHLAAGKNEPTEQTKQVWEELQSMGGRKPMLGAQDLVYIALRDLEKEEWHSLDRHDIEWYPVTEVRGRGVAEVCAKIGEKFADCDSIAISFDVDSMDSETVSDGTGTPVPGGLSEEEARELLEGLIQLPKVRCLEITEVNPTLDTRGNRMAEVAFRLLENSCKVISETRTSVTSA